MKRRHFMAAVAAATLIPSFASAEGFIDYTPGLIKSELAAGKTVFVDYGAAWCSTCARQERVINELRAKSGKYDDAMTFIKVDWDTYSGHNVTTSRNIPRRSTLLVLKGDEELGRIVAGTSKSSIRSLMDLGL